MRGAWLEGRRLFLPRSRITKFNIHKNIRGAGAGAAEVGEINCLIMKHDIFSVSTIQTALSAPMLKHFRDIKLL